MNGHKVDREAFNAFLEHEATMPHPHDACFESFVAGRRSALVQVDFRIRVRRRDGEEETLQVETDPDGRLIAVPVDPVKS